MNLIEMKARAIELRSQIELHNAAIRTLCIDLEPLEEAITSDACGFAVGDVIEWSKYKGRVARVHPGGTKTSFVLEVTRILKSGADGAGCCVYSFNKPRKVAP